MAKPAGDLDEVVALLRRDRPAAAMLHADAPRDEPGGVCFELASDLVVPAESLESWVLQAVSFPARTKNGSRRAERVLEPSSPASEEAIKLSCQGASFRRGPDSRRLGRVGRGVKPLAPHLARGASLGRAEEVLQRHVDERALGVREQLVAVAKLAA